MRDFGGVDISDIGRRLATPIRKWEREHAGALVQNLLHAEHGAVTEQDEVLGQLQRGAIASIVVASDFPLSLHECDRCG